VAHILLADDDDAMRTFLTTSLERAGHQVAAFADGLAAFLYMQENDIPVDLLLTDIVMPGMDGIELSERALGLRQNLKVMYITGFGTVSRDKLPGAAKDAQILAKPLHLGHLIAEVEKRLAQN
jgi:two-component system, cell cycle response regulator CpdR